MKVLFGASAAVLLLASPGLAQTPSPPASASAQCTFSAAPTLADGANATRDQMTAKSEEVTAWLATRQQEEAACATAIQAIEAQQQAMVAARAASGADRQSVVNNWNTEVTEFGGRANTRSRGGVLTRPDH